MKYLILFFLLFKFSLTFCQVVPNDKIYNWNINETIDTSTISNVFINVLNFGLDNSGNIANDNQLSLIINSNNSAILYFPEGEYLFNNSIVVPSNFVLQGDGSSKSKLKFNVNNDDCIKIIGELNNNPFFPILSSLSKGDVKLKTTNSNEFDIGDWVKITFNDQGIITSSWANSTVGEIVKITSIIGDSIFFYPDFRLNLFPSDSIKIQKLLPVENVGIKCLNIENSIIENAGKSNILFKDAVNCWISSIESKNCNLSHVRIFNSTFIHVSNSTFQKANSYGNGGKGYGVLIENTSCFNYIFNNILTDLRHAVLLQSGANSNVVNFNYVEGSYWEETSLPSNSSGDLVLHGNYPFANLFEYNDINNIVIDNSHGQNGPDNFFFRNKARNWGIFFSDASSPNQTIVGNEVINTGFPMSLVNYNILGVNHFLYANNNKGNVSPTGTSYLPDTSYFYNFKPNFVSLIEWCSIGIPNNINSGFIPAGIRFQNQEFDQCNTELTEVSDLSLNNFEFKNPLNSFDKINLPLDLKEILIYESNGRFFKKQIIINNELIIDLNPGFYFFQIGHKIYKRIVI